MELATTGNGNQLSVNVMTIDSGHIPHGAIDGKTHTTTAHRLHWSRKGATVPTRTLAIVDRTINRTSSRPQLTNDTSAGPAQPHTPFRETLNAIEIR